MLINQEFYKENYLFKKNKDKINIFYLSSIICITAFLFLNPFLALFFLAILSKFITPPKLITIFAPAFAFTLFFYSRKYGVFWADDTAGDDVTNYILLYNTNFKLSFSDIFTRFFEFPGNNEPLWHLPFWFLLNFLNFGENQFLFTHYFLIFIILFYSFYTISNKYFLIIALAYFFITPGSLDSIFHIWRQQLAFSFFLLGTVKYFISNKRIGIIYILITPLIHLVSIIFVIFFLLFISFKQTKFYLNKLPIILFILFITSILFITFTSAINYLSTLNLDRIIAYIDSDSGNNFRQIIVMLFFSSFLLFTFYFFKNDNWNNYIFFITLILSFLTVLLPSISSIINRVTYFSIPFIGIYIFRWLIFNFSKNKILIFVIFIFLSGLLRTSFMVINKISSIQFLAFEHPLDPFMGSLKLLFNYN